MSGTLKGYVDSVQHYPKELLKPRIRVEGNVISCLLNDPLLLDETNLDRSAFVSNNGRFLFDILTKLRMKGIENTDMASIYTVLSEEERKTFEDNGGYDGLEYVKRSADLNNFDSFLDELFKEQYLCTAYENNMLSVDKPIRFEGRTINLLHESRKLSFEEVKELFESILFSFDSYQHSSTIIESTDVTLDKEWLESLKQGDQRGTPFDYAFEDMYGEPIQVYPRLSRQVKGLLTGTVTMIGGFSSTGKSTFWIGIIMSFVAQGHRVLFLSNEEDSSRFRIKCLAWVAHNIFKSDLLMKGDLADGDLDNLTPEQKELVNKSIAFWEQNNLSKYIRYVQIPDADMVSVRKQIRYYAQNGYDTVLYDTFKIQAVDIKDSRQDLALVRDSRVLDEMAKKYDLTVIASVQLAERFKGLKWLNSSCLSNSKQIKEILENLFLMRNVFPEELDPTNKKHYIRVFRYQEDPEKGWIKEEIKELDQNAVYKVLFIEKSRSGANSEDLGQAILLRFDGDYSTFVEYAWCEPRHGNII